MKYHPHGDASIGDAMVQIGQKNLLLDGKVVIVIDDENRENEGDFIAAADKVTPEMINFMATHKWEFQY